MELFKTSINYFRELKFNFRAQVKEGEPPNEVANSLSHMRMGVLNPKDCMYLTSLFRCEEQIAVTAHAVLRGASRGTQFGLGTCESCVDFNGSTVAQPAIILAQLIAKEDELNLKSSLIVIPAGPPSPNGKKSKYLELIRV